MSFSAIMKETGRATHDEMRRMKQDLEFLLRFRGSIEQSLTKSQSPTGPPGTNDIYLRLDAGNDPVTGPLSIGSTLIVSGVATFSNTIYARSSGTGIDAWITSTNPIVRLRTGSGLPETTSPDAIVNANNNLYMWFESDTLTTYSDAQDVQSWTSGGLAATQGLEQGTASVAPHYRNAVGYTTPLGKASVVADAIGQRMTRVSGGIDWRFAKDIGGGTQKNGAFVVVYRTDTAASSNNILTFGNVGSGGVKRSFRPIGNADLGNSYVYNDGTLEVYGSGHAGHSGGTFHIALFWYDSSDDTTKCYIDGVDVSSGLVSAQGITIDSLFQDVGGGTENVAAGTGISAAVMIGNNGTGAMTTLDEATKVHDFIALEYMGVGYTIQGGVVAGDFLQMRDSSDTVISVFDEDGKLHIGGSNPVEELDVEGAADISGALAAGSLSVTGDSTLSNTVINSLTVNGTTFSGTFLHASIVNATSGPSFHMTGPGPNFGWIEDNHTTQSDWRMRLNAGQLEWRDNVGASGINTVITFEPGAPTDCWTFEADGTLNIKADAGVEFGAAGNEASIKYDGTDLNIDSRVAGSGDCIIKGTSTWFTKVSGLNGQLTVQNTAPSLTLAEISFTTTSQIALRQDAGIFDILDQSEGTSNAIIRIHTVASGFQNSAGAFQFRSDDLWIDNDSKRVYWGEAQDASIMYNGTDMVINPQDVGTGDVVITAGNFVVTNGYVNMAEITAPGTPPSGTANIFLNTATGKLSVIKDTGSVISLEEVGGGTGSGSSGTTYTGPWLTDLPLTSPATEDDDFNDSALAGKWTESDGSGNAVFTERAWGLEVDSSGGTNTDLVFLHQAKPTASTTYTVMAKVSFQDHQLASGGDWLEVGVGIFEDVATNPTTDGVGFISARFDRNASPDRLYVIGQHWTDFDTYSGNLGDQGQAGHSPSGAFDPSINATLYLRMRKSGTTYGMDWSVDGFNWMKIYEGAISSITSNDERVGLVIRESSEPDARAIVHWFRVVDGTADFFQQPPGRRNVFFGP